jgi:hypothetical protein
MTRLRPDAKAVLVNDLPRAGKKPQKVISLAELLENLHLNACRSAFGEAIPHSQPGSADHFNAEGPAFARAIRQRAPIHQEEHSLSRAGLWAYSSNSNSYLGVRAAHVRLRLQKVDERF